MRVIMAGSDEPSGPDSRDPRLDAEGLGPAPAVLGRERIKAGVRAALFGDTPAGASDPDLEDTWASGDPQHVDLDDVEAIGRFRILGRLGAGGMGVVFSAYDPELDRKVALKLLRPERGGSAGGRDGGSRLQREAKAMARLSHPNVITVHEVGIFAGQVFVAMEFVDGPTLTQWLRSRPAWPEVAEVFLQAGRGLAAAHAARLVHRDFKPDNVLLHVDTQGRPDRVRVVDFGLARKVDRTPTQEIPELSFPLGDDLLSSPLTETGALMGTPAYMSPEQYLGQAADARSDQFSFCVALYEAAFGKRPFEARSLAELMQAVTEGEPEVPKTPVGVPRWVWPVLRRGLAVDPSRRWESMDVLLAQLERSRTRWRVYAGGLVGAGLVSFGTWAVVDDASHPVEDCAALGEAIDEVWTGQRRDRVRSFLLDAPGAGEIAWSNTARALDDYAQRWSEAATQLCASALVARGEHDDPTIVAQRSCLAGRKAEFEALVSLLAGSSPQGDAGVAQDAYQAAGQLSSIEACRSASADDERTPEQLRASARLRGELGRIRGLGLMGRYDEASREAAKLEAEARAIGDEETRAEALLLRGDFLLDRADYEQAQALISEAAELAASVKAHETRARALITLIYAMSVHDNRWSEAEAIGAEVRAVIDVLGGDPFLSARLDGHLSVAAEVAGKPELAETYARQELEAVRRMYGESHPKTVSAYVHLARATHTRHGLEQSAPVYEAALKSARSSLGAEHPMVAETLHSYAVALARGGEDERALEVMQRSRAIYGKVLPKGHPDIANAVYHVGRMQDRVGQQAQAVESLRAAIELQRASEAEVPTFWHRALARIAAAAGQVDIARAEALEVLSRGDETPVRDRIECLLVLAKLEREDDPSGAAARVERALSLLERAGESPLFVALAEEARALKD